MSKGSRKTIRKHLKNEHNIKGQDKAKTRPPLSYYFISYDSRLSEEEIINEIKEVEKMITEKEKEENQEEEED